MTTTPPRLPQTPPVEVLPDPPQGTGRSRGHRVARVLSWVAVSVSLVTLLGAAGVWVALRHYDNNLTRVDIRLPQASPVPAAAGAGSTVAAPPAPAQNFLVVGSDTREAPGTAGFGAPKGSPAYVSGQRSDTVMLVHIPAGNGKATVVSFPRDSWVKIPAYKNVPAHHQRINSAYALGGAPLLAQVVENLSGLRIDHYVGVNFYGFQRMVNALGGVNLCVRTTRHDADSKDYLKAGTHHVNGTQALGFVRDRKGLPNGDLDRIADQQYFLSVLLHKVLSTGTLANPLRLNAFLNAMTSSLTVDRDLSLGDLRDLAVRMRHLDAAHVTLLTAPIANAGARIGGADVVLLDLPKTAALFKALRSNTTVVPATSGHTPSTRTASPGPTPPLTAAAAANSCAP